MQCICRRRKMVYIVIIILIVIVIDGYEIYTCRRTANYYIDLYRQVWQLECIDDYGENGYGQKDSAAPSSKSSTFFFVSKPFVTFV